MLQLISYVILTSQGHVLVVDGGNPTDSIYLKRFLNKLGNHVNAWFITHPHPDHLGALSTILGENDPITIDKIYASFPTLDWIAQYESQYTDIVSGEYNNIAGSKIPVVDVAVGDKFSFDEIEVTVLSVRNPEIQTAAINNSCMTLRMEDSFKSIIFLGDLQAEGGEKLLAGPMANLLKADFVQMAHHGGEGVGDDVYQAIGAKYYLWPTSELIYDNIGPGGFNTGPWPSLTTRAWVSALSSAADSFLAFKGLMRFY